MTANSTWEWCLGYLSQYSLCTNSLFALLIWSHVFEILYCIISTWLVVIMLGALLTWLYQFFSSVFWVAVTTTELFFSMPGNFVKVFECQHNKHEHDLIGVFFFLIFQNHTKALIRWLVLVRLCTHTHTIHFSLVILFVKVYFLL